MGKNTKENVTDTKDTLVEAALETVDAAEETAPVIQKKPKEEEKESISIPRALDGEERTLFVSINGYTYLLPKGKESLVPKSVAREIRRSQEAQNAWDERAEALVEAGKKPSNM